tara:strand:+ start:2235 stop:8159 length:5925 start_codon:yes stop_codon:yes gene_type:complete
MPKRVLQLTDFSGGLNAYSDARDIEDQQYAQNWNAAVDTNGIIRVAGMASDSIYTDSFTNENFQAGYGLFQFSVDYGLFSIDASFNSGITTGVFASVTSASVVVLQDRPSTSAVNSYYTQMTMLIFSGAGKGEARTIKKYVGSSRTITLNDAFATTPTTGSKYYIFRWKPDGINWKGKSSVANKDYITDGNAGQGMLETDGYIDKEPGDFFIFSKQTPVDDTTANFGYIEYRPNTTNYTSTGVVSTEAESASDSSVTLTVDGIDATATALLNKRLYKSDGTFLGICTSINSTTEIVFSGGIHAAIANDNTLYTDGIRLKPGLEYTLAFDCALKNRMYNMVANGDVNGSDNIGISSTGILVNQSVAAATTSSVNITTDATATTTLFLNRDIYQKEVDGSYTFIGRCTAVGSSTQITFGGGIAVDLKDNTTLYAAGWGERAPWVEIFSPTVADKRGCINTIADTTPTTGEGNLSGTWNNDTAGAVISQTSTSGSGEGALFKATVSSGTLTIDLTARGYGYAAGDTILLTDPSDEDETATLTVNSVNTTGLTLYADSHWKHGNLNSGDGGSVSGYLDNAGINYVANGDFADGTTGWTTTGDATFTADDDTYDGHDGTLLIDRSAYDEYDDSSTMACHQDLKLEPNTPYHLNFLYWADKYATITVKYIDGISNNVMLVDEFLADTDMIGGPTENEFRFGGIGEDSLMGYPKLQANFEMTYLNFTTPDSINSTITVRINISPKRGYKARFHGITVHKAYNDLVTMGGVHPFCDSSGIFSLHQMKFKVPENFTQADDWIIRIHAGHYGRRDNNTIPEYIASSSSSNANQEVYIDKIKLSDAEGDTMTLLNNNANERSNISFHSKKHDTWLHNFLQWSQANSKPVYDYVNGMLKISDANFDNNNNNFLMYYSNKVIDGQKKGWIKQDYSIPTPLSIEVKDLSGDVFEFSDITVDLYEDYFKEKYAEKTYRETESTIRTNWPMDGFGVDNHTGFVISYWWDNDGKGVDIEAKGTKISNTHVNTYTWTGNGDTTNHRRGWYSKLRATPTAHQWYNDNIETPGPDSDRLTQKDSSGDYIIDGTSSSYGSLESPFTSERYEDYDAYSVNLTKMGFGNYGYTTYFTECALGDYNGAENGYFSILDPIPFSNSFGEHKVRNPLCLAVEGGDNSPFKDIENIGDLAYIEIEFGFDWYGTNGFDVGTGSSDLNWGSEGYRLPIFKIWAGVPDEDIANQEYSGDIIPIKASTQIGRTYGTGHKDGRTTSPEGNDQDYHNVNISYYHLDDDDGECLNVTSVLAGGVWSNEGSDAGMSFRFRDILGNWEKGKIANTDPLCIKLKHSNADANWNIARCSASFSFSTGNYGSGGGGPQDLTDYYYDQNVGGVSSGNYVKFFHHRDGMNGYYDDKALYHAFRIHKLIAHFYNPDYDPTALETSDGLESCEVKVSFAFNVPQESSAGWGQRVFKVGTSSVNVFDEESSINESGIILGESNIEGEFSSIQAGHAPIVKITISSTKLDDPFISKTKFYMKDIESEVWFVQFYLDHKTKKLHSTTSGVSVLGQASGDLLFFIMDRDNLRDFNEVNSYESETMISQDDSISNATLTARYRTSVVANNRLYAGNIKQNGETHGDRMLKSPIGKYNLLPASNFIDVAINDGDEITALAYYKDKILQFKKQKVFVINVSGDYEFLEDTFQNVGVESQASVTTTPHGICWANAAGCYLYDGKELKNLIENRIPVKSDYSQISNNYWIANVANSIPTLGYIKDTNSIIIKFDVNDGGNEVSLPSGASYHFSTKSWVFHIRAFTGNTDITTVGAVSNMITNSDGDVLYYLKDGASAADTAIKKWNYTPLTTFSSSNTKVFYWSSKDFTFGDIATRKKIYKVYITYKTDNGQDSGIGVKAAVNGSKSFTTTFNASTSVFAGTDTACYGSSTLDETDGIWKTAELKFSNSSEVKNIYSFQLQIFSDAVVESSFEINDISIVYRIKNIK